MADYWLLERPTLVDLLALAAIPAVLVVIHHLLPSGGQTLAFDYSQLNPLKMWTAGYVHLNDQHLQSNLLGYWVAILPTWILYRTWDRRREFWILVGVLVLAGPVVVSLGSYLVFRFGIGTTDPVGRGFSGVVAAMGGVLWASIPAYVYNQYGRMRAIQIGEAAILLPMVALMLSITDRVSILTGGVALFGTILGLVSSIPVKYWLSPSDVKKYIMEGTIVGYCILAIGFLLVNLFPRTIVNQEAISNIYGHGIGMGVGIVSMVLIRVLYEIRR